MQAFFFFCVFFSKTEKFGKLFATFAAVLTERKKKNIKQTHLNNQIINLKISKK